MGTQGPTAFYTATGIFMCVNVVVFMLRFWARKQQKQPLKIDDWLIVPAFLLNMGISIAIFYGVSQKANGYPTPPMPAMSARSLVSRTSLEQTARVISINNRTFFIVHVLGPFSLMCIKLSMLFFYRRIFVIKGNHRDWSSIVINFMIAVVFCWGFGFGFAYMFGCGTSFSTYRATAGAEVQKKCINTQLVLYAGCISGFIEDFLIIVIPIPLVWRLQLDTPRKLAVTGVFLTGSIAVIAALLRMVWFIWENKTPWNPAFDQMLLVSTFVFWMMIECQAGLLAACLPTLRRVFSSSSVDSVLRSVRSKLSLNSIRSNNSQPAPGKGSFQSISTPRPSQGSQSASQTESKQDLRANQIQVERSYAVGISTDDIEMQPQKAPALR
ncbi:hypothetical protein K491DRAFT_722089 [Lophiostoma macrostomum CBS 122681]|uniref:Rhodopsin domain-containing protein n=1 Tax=Lophiostoma macrostomum CBS 122681 TaxID=1314788 RepID=A0A6A6SMQ6_9PLEO|nr:hypothetical protein K491DRAFT_722089 [Lophiostoma macrostomum CBS 122681]